MGAYKIQIDKITCLQHADPNGSDEVWLLAQSDGSVISRYPQAATSTYSMKEDGSDTEKNWYIDGDFVIEFDGCCNLTLYEQDLKLDISTTDFLGCARFTSGADASSPKQCTNGDDSSYEVYFSWVS